MISPSEKRLTIALPSGIPRILTTSCASAGFALPVNTIRPSLLIVHLFLGWGREGKREKLWQGKKDSNPRMPESKSGALTNLATPLH